METNRTSFWQSKKGGYTQYGNICYIAVMLFAALSVFVVASSMTVALIERNARSISSAMKKDMRRILLQ